MHPHQSRFVAFCQQLLVLGVVAAVLVPAATIVSLDVVRERPGGDTSGAASADSTAAALAAYASVADKPSVVPAGEVDVKLHEFALTPAKSTSTTGSHATTAAYVGEQAVYATTVADETTGTTTIVSDPQEVTGFGTVGVTWASDEQIAEGDISIQVRTQTDGDWDEWQDLDYHGDHAPDPDTTEADDARPGTDEALVGHVDQVQVKAEVKSSEVPDDLKLAVIDPGNATGTTVESPDIDTSELPVIPDAVPDDSGDLLDTESSEDADPAADTDADSGSTDGLMLAAATTVTKPYIYSRAQWGANEKLREQTEPSYGTIHGGFVHHTVNANDYTAAEVPAIIRSIYAYHVKSRGWRDIGYNFLIDKFGRIWEGRYGGVDRAVVGAHTENYNSDSFGASAIGNFDIAEPPQEVVGAFGSLFAWKLSLHGVSAAATNVTIGKTVFASSIMGHRDTKATACPGKYLYARIPDIRRIAASAQSGWTFTAKDSDLTGTVHPDLIARRASDGLGVIIPTTGKSGFAGKATMSYSAKNAVVLSPDLTGDGRADLVVVAKTGKNKGKLVVRPGTGNGGFGKGIAANKKQQRGRNLLAAVGDVNGDGHADLFSRAATGKKKGTAAIWLGKGDGRFEKQSLKSKVFGGYDLVTAAGDVDGDGLADLIARDKSGTLWLHPGKGNGGFPTRRSLSGAWGGYDAIIAGDFTRDGIVDLLVRGAKTSVTKVRRGNGDGSFAAGGAPYRSLKKQQRLLGAANVFGDDLPDVLAVNDGKLAVIKHTGGTDLGTPVVTNLDLRSADLVLNAGDWNGDGHGDVIYRQGDGLLLALGDGNGSFGSPAQLGSGFGAAQLIAAVGDLSGDGKPDVMAQTATGVMLYPGNGQTGFDTPFVMYSSIGGSSSIAAGKWDADGAPDVLVRNGNSLFLYPSNGPGGLMAPRQLNVDLSPYDWVVGVGSLAVTGHPDLVVRNPKTGGLYALKGAGDGSIAGKPRALGFGFGGYDLAG
ncbi:FG-GAP-like repeat-containing protein [Nocardioides sp.]|uniref:FG-GAP-like repeat-containing protein n=1 Tax=Nocardioides sp. TaxID=35761 RepID=UPI0039E27B08